MKAKTELMILRILGTLAGIFVLNLAMVLIYGTVFIAIDTALPMWIGQSNSVAIIILVSLGTYLIADNSFIPLIISTERRRKEITSVASCSEKGE